MTSTRARNEPRRHLSRPVLSNVVFETTARCNLDCRYCYTPWKRPGARAPEPASYRASMRTLGRLYAQVDIRRLAMSGGEPLLSERFAELVLWCRLRGTAVTIISNGTVGTEEDYGRMVDLGVSLLELPLHAAETSVHDQMTGMPGSGESARRSIETAVRVGATVATVIVLTRLNCGLVAETLKLTRALGVRRVLLNRFNVGGNGIRHRAELAPSQAELAGALDSAHEVAHALDLTLSANVCTPWCVIDPRRYPLIPMSSCSLDPRRMPLALDSAGNLRLCNHSPVVLGNIHERPVAALLESDYARDWQRVTPRPCTDCSLWARCRGGCRAAAEQLGGSLHDADPIVPF